jgi:hypothetical protein
MTCATTALGRAARCRMRAEADPPSPLTTSKGLVMAMEFLEETNSAIAPVGDPTLISELVEGEEESTSRERLEHRAGALESSLAACIDNASAVVSSPPQPCKPRPSGFQGTPLDLVPSALCVTNSSAPFLRVQEFFLSRGGVAQQVCPIDHTDGIDP